MSNYQALHDLTNQVPDTHTTQVAVTRTRAILLNIKKLTDTMRKELLAQGHSMKKPTTRKETEPLVVVPEEPTDSQKTPTPSPIKRKLKPAKV
jgi:hypothetical protein